LKTKAGGAYTRTESVCFGEKQWAVLLNEKRLHKVWSGTDTVIAAIIYR
jgi:hypothetical protein